MLIKLFLIKLRALFFGGYWYLRLFPSFKKDMLKLKVSKLKVTRVDLWTTHVMFFTGSLQHKPVFVKLYRDNNKNQREALLKTDHAINDKIYNDLKNEEELYNYKRKKARELMQVQADAFLKH